jgi:uroporphyrinogen decarboxylase
MDDFRRFCKPYLANFIREVKKRTKAKIFLHSCGSVIRFIDDFVDMGVDVLNPIQPLAYGMDPQTLKTKFGNKLCFHGGIDVQNLLPFEKPERVKDSVRRTLSILSKGGGYILGTSHVIGPEVPPENIVAMFDVGEEFGRYSQGSGIAL